MVHNEARYIEEWLAYHLLLKFDHFFIYDDQSTDNISSILAPYIRLGVVTLIPWDHNIQTVDPELVYPEPSYTRVQRFAIADCLYNHENESEWFGVWDVDEFIRLNEYFPDILAFLKYADATADDYHIPLTVFGPGKYETTPEGLVIWNYQMRSNVTVFGMDPNNNKFSGKSIYKARCGTASVHFSTKLRPGCRKNYGWIVSQGGPNALPISVQHYAIKSFEHFKEKMSKWNWNSETSFEELSKKVAYSNWVWDGYVANYAGQVKELVECMARYVD